MSWNEYGGSAESKRKSKRTRLVWIAGGAAIVLIIVMMMAVVKLSPGPDSSASKAANTAMSTSTTAGIANATSSTTSTTQEPSVSPDVHPEGLTLSPAYLARTYNQNTSGLKSDEYQQAVATATDVFLTKAHQDASKYQNINLPVTPLDSVAVDYGFATKSNDPDDAYRVMLWWHGQRSYGGDPVRNGSVTIFLNKKDFSPISPDKLDADIQLQYSVRPDYGQ